MLPEKLNIVSPNDFDRLFQEQALIADVSDKKREVEYERRDSFLIFLIRREVERHFGTDEDRAPFVGDDWWPDHTRHMELTPEHCSPEFLGSLRSLLTDEYADYRIQLCVYADKMDGKSYIGSLLLYADHAVVEKKLYTLLNRAEPR